MRQFFFSGINFLSTKMRFQLHVYVILHANTNLPNGSFLHEQFLISKYLPILHALLHLQSQVLGFHL